MPIDSSLLPIPVRYTAAVTALIVTWWVTETVPIYVTALIPLVLFPVLGVLTPSTAAKSYADETVFLFMGGFFIAIAMQKWNLHRRVALTIVAQVGTEPRNLILGFMVATAFISFWISNTATAMMMMPIAMAVITTLVGKADGQNKGQKKNFTLCLVIGVTYAATIGGMGTLIGTPPNGILVAQIKNIFPGTPPIDFFSFMLFAVPLAASLILIAWVWLTYGVYRNMPGSITGSSAIIREELEKCGRLNRGELITLIVFIFTALAWVFRTEKQIGIFILPGIATFIPTISDTTIALAGAIVLFLLPVNLTERQFVLDWESAREIPWGILILFGGGICLSEAFLSSGLAGLVADQFGIFRGLPVVLVVLIIVLGISFLSEVVSNTAMASIMIPLMAITSISLGVHPYVFMIAAAFGSSLGFMLPVGTPPNAIAYGTGYLTTKDMIRAGIALNIIGALLVTFVIFTLVPLILDLGVVLPARAQVLK